MDQDTEMMDMDDGSQPSSSGSVGGGTRLSRRKSSNELTLLQFPNKDHKRFQVRKWTAMALWAYDITVDNCAICRNHIMDKCIECQSVQEMTNIDENCTIAWGKCSHVFHMHCISKWINTRKVCPLDNRPWEYKKYGT